MHYNEHLMFGLLNIVQNDYLCTVYYFCGLALLYWSEDLSSDLWLNNKMFLKNVDA